MMDKCAYPCPDFKKIDQRGCISTFHGVTLPVPPVVSPTCLNLLQNPSFESGLTGWVTDHVNATDSNPFEGTQVATLGSGVASMFQDVSLACLGLAPLFLSFHAAGATINSGNLVAAVLWLDKDHNTIGSGLRLFIPPSIRIPTRVTFFDITDQPPTDTVWVRLLFSKGAGTPPDDLISIDQVILTPANSINLIQNPGFELGLTGWTTTTFEPNFTESFTGLVQAVGPVKDGILFQDVPLTDLPANSALLVSFAVRSLQTSQGSLSVQVLWLDQTGKQIGPSGLDLLITNGALDEQVNFLTYLDLTQPVPCGAVAARIVFTAREPEIFVDQVILAGVKTPNLVQNPGFEAGLNNWTAVNWTAVTSGTAYADRMVARGATSGGVIFQDVLIADAVGHCYLFNCGLSNRNAEMLINVVWLDNSDREIGLGLSLVVPRVSGDKTDFWLVYTGSTEPAPTGAVKARVQFTKSAGNPGTFLDIDQVVLGRLV